MNNQHNTPNCFESVKMLCLELYKTDFLSSMNIYDLVNKLMDLDCVPIHHPVHHFIVPASLLTFCCKINNVPYSTYESYIEEAHKRALNVLGGFCGFYGDCGAAVGCGIFYSIFMKVSPLNTTCWASANRLTGETLVAMSSVDGPRCCKRGVFFAIKQAAEFIDKQLDIKIPLPDQIKCRYFYKNTECKKDQCPFYPSKK